MMSSPEPMALGSPTQSPTSAGNATQQPSINHYLPQFLLGDLPPSANSNSPYFHNHHHANVHHSSSSSGVVGGGSSGHPHPTSNHPYNPTSLNREMNLQSNSQSSAAFNHHHHHHHHHSHQQLLYGNTSTYSPHDRTGDLKPQIPSGGPPLSRLADVINKPAASSSNNNSLFAAMNTPNDTLPPRNKFYTSSAVAAGGADFLDGNLNKLNLQQADLSFTPAGCAGVGAAQRLSNSPSSGHGDSLYYNDSLIEGYRNGSDENAAAAATASTWITIFGFPPSSASYVLQEFSVCGQIVKHIICAQGNWMHIQFQTRLQAQKALGKNGKVLGNQIMVGVMPCIDKNVMNSGGGGGANTSALNANNTDSNFVSPAASGLSSNGVSGSGSNRFIAKGFGGPGSRLDRSQSLRTGVRPALGSLNQNENMSLGQYDDLRTIEHSTLKVPYEVLNKQYRNIQKSIDRDCSALTQSILSVDKGVKGSDTVSRAELLNSFTSLIDKLRSIKKRSAEYKHEERGFIDLIRKRIDHLKHHECCTSNQLAIKNFKRIRVDRMLVDYFLRQSLYDTASMLASKSNIEPMTNIDIFQNERDVVFSLRNKDTSKCLAWCNENKSKLKKINSNLEFALRQQEFIELIRSQRCLDAVYHSRKYFVNLIPSQMIDVQKSMVLLAYAKSADSTTHQELLADSRWDFLIDFFKQENYKIHSLPDQSAFLAVLQAGLSSIKTPTCYRKVTSVKNSNCPVCHPNLNAIARPLPYAYCSNSKLICAYSGEQLNEHNIPMMLPNGHVYGYNSLLKIMSESGGQIKCPRTQNIYEFSDAQKSFIL